MSELTKEQAFQIIAFKIVNFLSEFSKVFNDPGLKAFSKLEQARYSQAKIIGEPEVFSEICRRAAQKLVSYGKQKKMPKVISLGNLLNQVIEEIEKGGLSPEEICHRFCGDDWIN